ncbi:MAG: hypothetical protein ABI693_27295 [Bryobacteraceae bacterium]
MKGLRRTVKAFLEAGIEEIYIDGSFCTEKPDPGDIDRYWVEPDTGVYDRIDPYWIDFETLPIPGARIRKWRMWAELRLEFYVHPIMEARAGVEFPEFFRLDRDGESRGVIRIVKEAR